MSQSALAMGVNGPKRIIFIMKHIRDLDPKELFHNSTMFLTNSIS